MKASRKTNLTAEFVESFLIFFYGCTNVFLEHLGGWGGEWSPSDMEHISITIMFMGGGLVSSWMHIPVICVPRLTKKLE